MSDTPGIPAAWYPDPSNSRQLRYWDGTTWTQQVRESGVIMSASAASAPLTDFTGYDRVGQSASYVPFSRGSAPGGAGVSASAGRTTTISSWLYALVPLLLLIHQFVSWDFSVDNFMNVIIHGALALVTVVLAVLLAAIDRSQLRSRGFTRTPPGILGLLPPIHVIVRLFATGPGAILVTLVALAVQVAVVVALVSPFAPLTAAADTPSAEPVVTEGMTAPFTEQQLAHLLTPEGMAEKVRFDASESSLRYDEVTCEPLPSTDLGAQTTCHASGQTADFDLLIQVLPNGTEVPFAIVSETPVLD